MAQLGRVGPCFIDFNVKFIEIRTVHVNAWRQVALQFFFGCMVKHREFVSDDFDIERHGGGDAFSCQKRVFQDADATGDLHFFFEQFVRELHATGGQKRHPVPNRNAVVDVGVDEGKDQFHHPFWRSFAGHFSEQVCELIPRDDPVAVGVQFLREFDGGHGRIGQPFLEIVVEQTRHGVVASDAFDPSVDGGCSLHEVLFVGEFHGRHGTPITSAHMKLMPTIKETRGLASLQQHRARRASE